MKPKLLMVMRLYTGLEQSLKSGKWEPEGVPTVYNFINQAVRNYDLSLVLTCKDTGKTYTSGWNENVDKNLSLKGLDGEVIALSGINYFPRFLNRKIAMIMRDLRHLTKIVRYIRCEKPDIIYCDGANVVLAFCLTKIFPKTPIVLRLLGICSFLRGLPTAKRFVHRIYKLSFKGDFAAVVGTQDGTGTEFFLERMLSQTVPRHVLLNGVKTFSSYVEAKSALPDEWQENADECFTILFVGRIEKDKGIITFVNAICSAIEGGACNIRAIVVGSGSLLAEVKQNLQNNVFGEKIWFTGSVPHRFIHGFHELSDLYVSTNVDGNLTNANLEAIAANACMVFPEPQTEQFIDVKTSEYLSDCVVYFRVGDSDDLKEKILDLMASPQKREEYKMKLAKRKVDFMRGWPERVSEEMNILEKLISTEA